MCFENIQKATMPLPCNLQLQFTTYQVDIASANVCSTEFAFAFGSFEIEAWYQLHIAWVVSTMCE